MPRFTFFLALICLPLVVGCEGCRKTPLSEKEKEEQKKQAAQDDFSSSSPLPFPASPELGRNAIKPGHWLTASESLKANKFDARGELESHAGASGRSLVSDQFSESENPIANRRPVVMPKGQNREFNIRLYMPVPKSTDESRCFLRSRFVSSRQSTFFEGGSQPFRMMAPEEYALVILTSRPERFAKFRKGDWVRQPRTEFDRLDVNNNYHVVVPSIEGVLPLSETMLDWTGTAVVLWDDLPAEALTPDQQRAMGDWVRFGGQLIVNGADAAQAISQTGLVDVLPLVPTGSIELAPSAAEELLLGWAVATDRTTGKQIALAKSQSGRIAIDGKLSAGAKAIDQSGNLILSRRVGRGEVVQARVDVTSDWLVDWDSYDSFVNNVLVGRPKRRYVASQAGESPRQRYPSIGRGVADASINTQFRLFSRDAARISKSSSSSEPPNATGQETLFASHPISGLGGWNDLSDVMQSCQEILRSESGIEIPKSGLVIKSLGIYLLLLVPVNYLVFRMMGRLEYAWLAVPVIAIGGAIVIARAARLDIGFARSQNEIAVLELQPNYGRGHLTRVVAVYNSLSSQYKFDFKTIDGCGLPIEQANSDSVQDGVFETSYREGPTLAGLGVGSNRIRMFHLEQMVDVGGGIRLGDDQTLVNEASFDLSDAFVIERTMDGTMRVAVVGGCQAGQSTKLRFRESRSLSIASDLPMKVHRLIRRYASPGALERGAIRLLARFDGSMDGVTITPEATQRASQTMVVAHLRHAARAKPEADVNLFADVRVAVEPNAQIP